MFITSRPTFQFNNLLKFLILFFKRNIWFKSNLKFTTNGKTSLIMILNDLKIKKGCNILIPTFICESIPKILKLYGFKIVYYELDINGSINLEKIKKIIKKKNIKAFLLINYFGLNALANLQIAKNLKKLRKFKCKIIHDCSHTYQVKIINEKFYDGIFFSLKKVFPLPILGAYWTKNNKNTFYAVKFSLKDLFIIISDILLFILKYIPILNNILLNLKINNNNSHDKKIIEINQINYLTYITLNYNKKIKDSIVKRKKNLKYLIKLFRFKNYQLIFNNFHKHFVPQVFTILIKNKNIFNKIKNKGFKVYRWPGEELPSKIKNDKRKYKITNFLNNNIICIPIHESVNKKNIFELHKIVGSYEN